MRKSRKSKGVDWEPLAHRLNRIHTSETVLAPSAALFSHLLGLDGKTIASVVGRLRDEWGAGLRTIDVSGFRELRTELTGPAGDNATGDRWVSIAEHLSSGDYAAVLELLIQQNKIVMISRGGGGAPWIENSNDTLRVRFKDEQGSLPKQKDLALMWRFPYFLDSLRTVAGSLREN